MNQDLVTHLDRLAHASSAGEVIKELQHLAPHLPPQRMVSELSLSSLTALAEAHLHDRHESSRDALTGVFEASAFSELLRAHTAHSLAIDPVGEIVSVVLTLLDAVPAGDDLQTAHRLKTIARLCVEHVASDDYVGRIAHASIAVLPRNGGVRAARSVRARLIAACQREFAGAGLAPRLVIDLRDASGKLHDGAEVVAFGDQILVA
jgi:GGDEF domain-containing protein